MSALTDPPAGDYAARRTTYEAAYRAWLAGMTPAERASMVLAGLGAPEHDGPILGQALDHDVAGDAVAASSIDPEPEHDDPAGLDARDLVARAVGMLLGRANVRLSADALGALLKTDAGPASAEALAARHGIGLEAARAEMLEVAQHLGLALLMLDGARLDAQTTRALGSLRAVVGMVRQHSNAPLTIDCLALATGIASTDSAEIDIAQRHGLERAAISKRCAEIGRKLNLPPSACMRPASTRLSYASARRARIRREELLYSYAN